MIFRRSIATIMLLMFFSALPISYANQPISDDVNIQQTSDDPLYTINIPREIWNVKWSHNGEFFAIWGWETAAVYDAADGTVVFGIQHGAWIQGVEWSNDDTQIFTWSDDKSVRVTDAQSGEIVRELEHTASVYHAFWTSDESLLLTSGNWNRANLWDFQTGEILYRFLPDDPVIMAIWRNDEAQIVTYSERGTVALWDAATGEQIFGGHHENWLNGAVWNADYSRLITTAFDHTAIVWNTATGEEQLRLIHEAENVWQPSWIQDEAAILTFDGERYHVWDAEDGSPIQILDYDNLVLNQEKNHALGVRGDTVYALDLTSFGAEFSVSHDGTITGARWNQNETELLTWSLGGTARVWDAASGENLGVYSLNTEFGVAGAIWNSDESKLLVFSGAGIISVWDVP